MSTSEEVLDIIARLDTVEAALEAYEQAVDPAREATRVLGELARQAGVRLDKMDDLASSIRQARDDISQVLDRTDRLATVEDVRASFVQSQHDQARKRKVANLRLGFMLLWVMVVLGWTVNERVERCSPGSKAEKVTSVILDEGRPTLEKFRDAAGLPTPLMCDVTVPVRTHTRGDEWPTGPNYVGLGFYAAAIAVTVFAVRRRSWEGHFESDIPVAGGSASSEYVDRLQGHQVTATAVGVEDDLLEPVEPEPEPEPPDPEVPEEAPDERTDQ